jgi:uncharacterized membrane protein
LHLLATIVWIGGMIIGRVIVAPALKGLPDDTRREAGRAIGQRAASFTYWAIGVFIITGLAMLSQNANYAGFLVLDSMWTRVILVKHLAIAALVVSTAYVNSTVSSRIEAAASDAERTVWLERRKDLGDVNLLLGVVILGLAAIATAIPVA